MTSSKMFILPAIYHTKCEFSSLSSFMGKIITRIDTLPFDKQISLKAIKSIIDDLKLEVEGSIINQVNAEKLLIAKDLMEIGNKAIELKEFDPTHLMINDFNILLNEAADIFLGFNS